MGNYIDSSNTEKKENDKLGEEAQTSFEETKKINYHNDGIVSLLLLSDGRLASCSVDTTIKVYNMKNNYHCDLTLEGHKSGVLYISQLLNDKLISCSFDGEIKVWLISLTSYECDHTITKAHGGWINKIIPLTNNRMASCSNDMTIKIWNSNPPYNHLKTLEGHEGAISSIIQLKNKEIILSGSCYDNTLRVWNVSSYQCETIIKNIQCWWSNCMLELEFNKVIVGEMKKITVINLDSYQIERRDKHQKLNVVYSLMVLKDDKILCGNNKGTFCIYDIKLNTIEKINTSFDTYISGLLSIDQQTFISCSLGRNIKVWKY